jgi:hypothetical protein
MSETFNFSRFWTYFKYDLKQMWRNHSKAAILIGGASALFYVLWVMCSLVFTQQWTSPVLVSRVIVLIVAFAILEFYQVRTYGYLTEKKAGSSWLMIPASKGEKFVSMLLITIIVIPILFFAVYFILDGFLSLVDPTYGEALFTGALSGYRSIVEGLSEMGESPIELSVSSMAFPTIVGTFCNFLYFLLCGICFKKNKLVSAIAILFGLSLGMSLITGLVMPWLAGSVNWQFMADIDEQQAAQWLVGLMNAMVVLECLVTIGLGWGVWRRIKTLQH